MTALPLRAQSPRRLPFVCVLAAVVALLTAPVLRAADHAVPTAATSTSEVTPAPAHAGSEAAGHEEKPELMPGPGTVQIITTLTTLIIFGLLLVVLSKYAWGPIVSGLKAREDKIRKDIKDAEEARLRAERT